MENKSKVHYNKESNMNAMNRQIVRVSKTEFETADGNVRPMLFDLDETPTVEEFQEIYDDWFNVFLEKGLIENERNETAINR
jgi:hypothetical protein